MSARKPLTYQDDGEGPTTWIVWAVTPEAATLVAICSREDITERYRPLVEQVHPGATFHAEQAPVDHVFGAADLRSLKYRAARKAARERLMR